MKFKFLEDTDILFKNIIFDSAHRPSLLKSLDSHFENCFCFLLQAKRLRQKTYFVGSLGTIHTGLRLALARGSNRVRFSVVSYSLENRNRTKFLNVIIIINSEERHSKKIVLS
jgi:hypothetical protein